MLRAIVSGSFIALAAIAQSPADRPSFEVASIKTYPPGAPFPPGPNGINVSPDGVAWRYARLQSCISWAYEIPGRIVGPDWIADRYDIAAKASGPVSKAQLRLMVQTLLEDRFKLKVHREMQDLPVVVLTVAKNGPKNLHQSQAADAPRYEPVNGTLVFAGPMSNFASILGNSPPYGVREDVVDRTGLAGWFDLTLDVKDFDVNDPEFGGKYNEMQSAAFAFLSNRLEKKYGLKLEHRKIPMQCLVVDSGNRTPTEN
jgi:uncharacterized protein (TIGR03435 family)